MPRSRSARSLSNVLAFPEPPKRSNVWIVGVTGASFDWRLSILGDLLIVIAGHAGRRVWAHAAMATVANEGYCMFSWRGYLFILLPDELSVQVLNFSNEEAWCALTVFVESRDLDPGVGESGRYLPARLTITVDPDDRLVCVIPVPPPD